MQSAAKSIPPVTEPVEVVRSSSFYTAMRIMPQNQRESMYAIYAFCRAVDDIADSTESSSAARMEALNHWRQNIALLYQENTLPQLHGLAEAIRDFNLNQADFIAVIDGMEMDISGEAIHAPPYAKLYLSCDRVACAVGRLTVRVMGLEPAAGLDLAHNLGLALQLTNILRDLDEDAALGRLYLPAELLDKAGIKSRNPAEVLAHPATQQVCKAIADEALSYFQMADNIMNGCDRKQVRTARVMSEAYRSMHAALVTRGFAVPRHAVTLNKARLAYILARNLLF